MSYSQVITSVGLAKIAAALAGGDPVVITEGAVGDVATAPDVAAVALGNEVWRGDINRLESDGADRVQVEVYIPAADGGFWIREAGLFDEDGDLILVALVPPAQKPDPATDGAGLGWRSLLTIEIANAATALDLTVDDTVALASRAYVDANAVDPLTDHLDGGANKHDASEVDYEQSDVSERLEYAGTNTAQAVLQILARALPIAVGTFKLADGANALVEGAGWDGSTPITRTGLGLYKLKLAYPVRDITDQSLAPAGMTVQAFLGAHGTDYVGSYCYEVDPASRASSADEIEIQCVRPDDHAEPTDDAGPVAWGADPDSADADGVRLHVAVYASVNFQSALPALRVLAP